MASSSYGMLVLHPLPLVARALAHLVGSCGHGAAWCTSADEGARLLQRRRLGVVLFDPVIGPAGAARLRDQDPDVRLLMVAPEVDPAVAAWALDSDVDGVVLSSADTDDVLSAIDRVVAGQAVFPAGWLAAARRLQRRGEDLGLSHRQVQVLELLAAGLSNDEIACRLVISCNTVKFHVAAIYERLGVHTRVQAAAALARGGPLATTR